MRTATFSIVLAAIFAMGIAVPVAAPFDGMSRTELPSAYKFPA